MAILDILASITGEKPSPAPTPVSRPSPSLGKRKAEDELRPASTKAARAGEVPEKSSLANGMMSRPSPRPTDRPLSNPLGKPNEKQTSFSRPVADKRKEDEKPGAAALKSRTAVVSTNGAKALPSRPPVTRPNPTDSGPPKKRSYAEIMARAKANSEQREALGKIQHKTVERSLTLKERKELKLEEARKARMEARKPGGARPGATLASSRDAAKTPTARAGSSSGSTAGKKGAPAEPKKIKKAALATTGYTGTARPRPGASSAAKPGAPARPSADARARDKRRFGGPLSRSQKGYDDEDDDLDDFIVDDEEEDEAGYGVARRYQYYSDEEVSDMEAGISDIEDEEARAERQARREDMEQEALERRLKQDKEERKRRFLEATKSKAGGR